MADDTQPVELTKRSSSDLAQRIGSRVDVDTTGLENQVNSLDTTVSDELERTRQSIESLQTNIEQLENRVTQIERTKARAQREATADLKDDLKETVEEKRRQYEERISDVLRDYQESIRRLKDRFLNSISTENDAFEQVSEEFADVVKRRESVTSVSEDLAEPATETYDDRLTAISESRTEFMDAIDDFLAHREGTAKTIDSLQTSVSGVSGAQSVHVPFWVVGIERNGTEEIRVLPVLERDSPEHRPTRSSPYASYLSEHGTHAYGDLTDTVAEYVQRDAVRDGLADEDRAFSDASVLPDDATSERFREAFDEYELRSRRTGVSADD
ncbi:hypothetical protein U3A55_08325 [Salarchaeum sp. III]|uniref:hypothetical protein n=1 Tax=Salarchaeum sp. III TaxID=3107927 RepID=UPI002ED90762